MSHPKDQRDISNARGGFTIGDMYERGTGPDKEGRSAWWGPEPRGPQHAESSQFHDARQRMLRKNINAIGYRGEGVGAARQRAGLGEAQRAALRAGVGRGGDALRSRAAMFAGGDAQLGAVASGSDTTSKEEARARARYLDAQKQAGRMFERERRVLDKSRMEDYMHKERLLHGRSQAYHDQTIRGIAVASSLMGSGASLASSMGGGGGGGGGGGYTGNEDWSAYNQVAQGDHPSDRRLKRAITEAGAEKDDLIDALKLYTYQYRPGTGLPQGRRLGVMAQDVERGGPMGERIVRDTPGGKVLDGGEAIGASLGLIGRLGERMDKLEAGGQGAQTQEEAARMQEEAGNWGRVAALERAVRPLTRRGSGQGAQTQEEAARMQEEAGNWGRDRAIHAGLKMRRQRELERLDAETTEKLR